MLELGLLLTFGVAYFDPKSESREQHVLRLERGSEGGRVGNDHATNGNGDAGSHERTNGNNATGNGSGLLK